MKPKPGLCAAYVEAGIAAMGAVVLPVRSRHLDELAQALAEDLSIVGSDTRFGNYKRLRAIWE